MLQHSPERFQQEFTKALSGTSSSFESYYNQAQFWPKRL